ncbi:MAG TPA: 2-methylcitrate dehydratase, partial [Coxiellaceae bacterium]|nr:2-methylcitrate dehydratase [Coxiellaceae bacterium]
KMVVTENSSYTEDYCDPDKRSIANAIQITFSDGSQSDWVEVHYPIGHRLRREEGIPYLLQKFKDNASTQWSEDHVQQVKSLCVNKNQLDTVSVTEWVSLMAQAAI